MATLIRSNTQRAIVQHLITFLIVLTMLLAPDSLITLGSRLAMAGVTLAAVLVISSRRFRDANLLISPLDFGWLPYILLTGLTVILAASPRRSLEIWLWLIAIQLPVAYGVLYLFRRGWPERTIYRALLYAGGHLYLFALSLTLNYVSQWLAARASGTPAPGFRLFGIMDHPNTFAMFIAISTPCIVAYLFLKMGRIERVLAILWLAGAILALFGTGSRMGLIAVVSGLVTALPLALLAHPSQPLARFRAWAAAHRRRAGQVVVAASVAAIACLALALYVQFGRPFQDNGGGRFSFYQDALAMFVSNPLAGGGPGGFLRNEVTTHSVPPWHPLQHAHDMYLNTLAESGLIGLIGFGALLAAAGWTCITVWRKRPSHRPLIAGPIGGLVAFCVGGLFDTPIAQFGPFFLTTVLLAYIAAGLPVQSEPKRNRSGLSITAVWAVVLLLVVVLVPYSVQWDVTRPDKPANVVNLTVAQRLDAMLRYDSADPLVTLQSAYDWAAAASTGENPEALPTAIARFERGIQLDPDLGIQFVNLSVLYRQAGRFDEAVLAARRATDRARNDGVTWLSLGIALEGTGQEHAAIDAYRQALELEPGWSMVGFWQVSSVRQAALAQYLASADPTDYYDLMAIGDKARLDGQKQAALKAFDEALKLAPGPVAATYVQGMIALTSGDLAAARAWLLRVTTMDIVEIHDQRAFVDAWLHLGDLAHDSGDNDTMLNDYRTAYSYLTSRGFSGFGSKGSPTYAILGYQRYGLISDYLPGVVLLDITPERAERFELLAQAAAAGGDVTAARAIYARVLESNPLDASARTALIALRQE